MKVVAVVPMKLNNSRLPGKNIKSFVDGYPLCHYILDTLLSVQIIDEVYVYCSSSEIQKYIPQGVNWLQRDKLLDGDFVSMTDVLKSFAKDVVADVYVMTHATAPYVSKKSIEKGLEAVCNQGYDSSFSVIKIQDFWWKNDKSSNYSLDNIPRTQDIEPIYKETSGFYIYRSEVMERLGRRIGLKPKMVEISEIEGIDIDEKEDFMIADALHYYKLHALNGGVVKKYKTIGIICKFSYAPSKYSYREVA